MKFKLKKREPIKDRIDDWFNMRYRKYQERMHEKCAAMNEWHEKFAWYPLEIDNNDDDTREWVWLVKVTQKYNAGVQSSEWRPGKTINKFGVERFTSKDYFKMKLTGEVDNDGFVDMQHDGTDATIHVTNVSPGSKVYVKKDSGSDYKQVWNKIL